MKQIIKNNVSIKRKKLLFKELPVYTILKYFYSFSFYNGIVNTLTNKLEDEFYLDCLNSTSNFKPLVAEQFMLSLKPVKNIETSKYTTNGNITEIENNFKNLKIHETCIDIPHKNIKTVSLDASKKLKLIKAEMLDITDVKDKVTSDSILLFIVTDHSHNGKNTIHHYVIANDPFFNTKIVWKANLNGCRRIIMDVKNEIFDFDEIIERIVDESIIKQIKNL